MCGDAYMHMLPHIAARLHAPSAYTLMPKKELRVELPRVFFLLDYHPAPSPSQSPASVPCPPVRVPVRVRSRKESRSFVSLSAKPKGVRVDDMLLQ